MTTRHKGCKRQEQNLSIFPQVTALSFDKGIISLSLTVKQIVSGTLRRKKNPKKFLSLFGKHMNKVILLYNIS